MDCSNETKNTGNADCGREFDNFPPFTIFCHPDNEDYFKIRIKDGVNLLTSRYILPNQYIKSKDLYVKMTEPEMGYDKYDFANDRFTVRCEIESIERIII